MITRVGFYFALMLPVVLYGCETWSLTFREECTLRVFENRVLRNIFGPKRDWVTGEWRRLLNEELYDMMRWAGHLARMGIVEMHAEFWWGDLKDGTT
jgi:hypothetical protein